MAGSTPLNMLWLALHFPQLPIEGQAVEAPEQPRAVVLHEGNRRRILACNAAATTLGVHAGQALKNAYEMVPGLITSDHDDHAQQAQLEQLTLWALHYTSLVSPDPPDALLLEIGSSLRLFGGIDKLLARLHEDIRQQGLSLCTAMAPTPTAALMFARAGVHRQLPDRRALAETLDAVPIAWLALDDFTLKGLRQSGLQSIGELKALPPASLTRRFGSQCTDLLYRLDGRLPDPRTAYQPPEHFYQALDLPLEAPDSQALAFPLNRLMKSLGGFLRSRDLGVRHLRLHLHHHHGPASAMTLKFLDATANVRHLFQIASERLGQQALNEPVIRLGLESIELAELTREGRDLFNRSQAHGDSVEQLMDRLAARLGRQALYTPATGDDHRPEKAWLSALLERQNNGPAETHGEWDSQGLADWLTQWPARPLWLLREPQPLQQAVTIHTRPERIENGWWDDVDVRRDYFIASTHDGSYYWVYRQRRPADDRLWLHGLFA